MLYSERHNCHNVINCTQLCISLSLYLSRCTIVCTSYHIVPRNLSLQRPSLCAGALMRELPRTRSTRTLKTSAAECKVLYITIYNLILYISSVLKYVETVSMSVNAAFAFMILFMVSFCHLWVQHVNTVLNWQTKKLHWTSNQFHSSQISEQMPCYCFIHEVSVRRKNPSRCF